MSTTEEPQVPSTSALVVEHSRQIDNMHERLNELSTDFAVTRDLALGLAEDLDRGPEFDKLYTALAKAQSEIQNAEHDAEADAGPYKYKYATLDSVLRAIREPFSKHGLCLIQLPSQQTNDKGVVMVILETIVGHTSGQEIRNIFSMYPPKQDPQGIGSCLTYMRRYTAMAVAGIAGAADDDAEGTKAEAETITSAEADKILSLADDLFGSDADALLARMCDKIFAVESVPKIPKDEAEIALARIQNTYNRKQREKEAATKPAKKTAGKKAEKPADEPPPPEE